MYTGKYQDLVLDSLNVTRANKVTHLINSKHDAYYGDKITVEGVPKINFASCGYLSLESREDLKEKAIDFLKRYGTTYSISRAFISNTIIEALEDRFSQMYAGKPCLTFSSTSLAHVSVLPAIIKSKDLIVFDQQVHFSIQTAAKINQTQGSDMIMIRHSNMGMLERILKNKGDKYEKIWYLIDGVYSMYGDVPPCEDLLALMNKYPQLHVYADGAHGIGWAGKYGTGYIFERMHGHDRFFLATTLGKAFGAMGGVVVFPTYEWYDKVRLFGGPFSYSHSLNPAMMGTCEATIDIFMSDELPLLQQDLVNKNTYLQKKLVEAELLVVSEPKTPIFYIALGKPNTMFKLVRRVMEDGFMMTVGAFPAVSNTCCGMRISTNTARTYEEIDQLVDSIKYHYPRVLEEEGIKENQIRRSFKLPLIEEVETKKEELFEAEVYDSITKVDLDVWNSMMLDKGVFDWLGMLSQEKVFSENELPEHNFDFYYVIIKDKETGSPVASTFLTLGILKDDMLDPKVISHQVEQLREKDPYYLTSKMLSVGSIQTEGEHIFIDKLHPNWEKGVKSLLEQIQNIYDETKADGILLRDIDETDETLEKMFKDEGYITSTLPRTNIIFNTWENEDEFYKKASKKRKEKLRVDIYRYEKHFKLEWKNKLSETELERFKTLFYNVKNRNLEINYFNYPDNFVSDLLENENWECLCLYLRPELEGDFLEEPVAMTLCYKGKNTYTPHFIGLDNEKRDQFTIYKTSLYHCVVRGIELKKEKIYFGFTADTTKRHWFGADSFPKTAFVQLRDLYNRKVISTLSKDKMIVR